MSWLDDMEAADPAYPSPGHEDPWATPRHAPDPAARQQDSRAPGEDIRGRTFTLSEAYQVAEDAVGLFLEYRDVHGREEDEARIEALGEIAQGLHLLDVADGALHRSRPPGPDWRALRESEARAREAGLRASIPRPDGQQSPGYQADALAWGTGRGIESESPEAEAD